jgi:hypothetical protein
MNPVYFTDCDIEARVNQLNYMTGEDTHKRFDLAATPLNNYAASKASADLKTSAHYLYKLARHVMLLYGSFHKLFWDYTLSYEELAILLAEYCTEGAFLRNIDASSWKKDASDISKPSEMSWDDFEQQLITYGRGIQNIYNEYIVPAVNQEFKCLEANHSDTPRRRLSNFM